MIDLVLCNDCIPIGWEEARRTHARTHARKHAHARMHARKRTHARTHARKHICKQASTQACICAPHPATSPCNLTLQPHPATSPCNYPCASLSAPPHRSTAVPCPRRSAHSFAPGTQAKAAHKAAILLAGNNPDEEPSLDLLPPEWRWQHGGAQHGAGTGAVRVAPLPR